MNILSVSAAVLLGATLAVGAQAQQAQPRTAPGSTSAISTPEYVGSQGRGDMFEIEAGKVAQQKALNADVKRFAQMMVDDHTLSKANMQQALKAGKVSTPAPKALDTRHNQALQQLKNTQAGQFDQAYLQSQVVAHREVLALNQTYSQTGDNPALRQYSQETIPVIQNHLSELQQMAQAREPAAAGGVASGSGGNVKTESGAGLGAAAGGPAAVGTSGSSGQLDVLDPGTGASSGAGIGQQVIQHEPIGPGGPRQFNQPGRDDGGLRDD